MCNVHTKGFCSPFQPKGWRTLWLRLNCLGQWPGLTFELDIVNWQRTVTVVQRIEPPTLRLWWQRPTRKQDVKSVYFPLDFLRMWLSIWKVSPVFIRPQLESCKEYGVCQRTGCTSLEIDPATKLQVFCQCFQVCPNCLKEESLGFGAVCTTFKTCPTKSSLRLYFQFPRFYA